MNDDREPPRPAERYEDLALAAQLAGLVREPDAGGVVLSGRCGECGYMLESPGHEITCGDTA